MANADRLTVELLRAPEVDAAAWDVDICRTSGNPTQLFACGWLGGALRRPIYAQVRRRGEVVLRWLLYRAGLPPLLNYLEIHSEPTSQDPTLAAAVLRAAEARFRPFEIRYHDLICNRWRDAGFFQALGFQQVFHYGTVGLDLSRGIPALSAAMHKNQRNRVSRGRREGLTLVEDSTVAGVRRLYPLLAATLQRSGVRPPRFGHIERHVRLLGGQGRARVFFAVKDGVDYGTSLDLVTPRLALGWLGGTREDVPTGTGNFLQWSVIEALAGEGVQHYDLGGVDPDAPGDSKAARILDSKLKYGGELTYHYGGVRICVPSRARLYQGLLAARAQLR